MRSSWCTQRGNPKDSIHRFFKATINFRDLGWYEHIGVTTHTTIIGADT